MEHINNTTKQAVYHVGALRGFEEVTNVEVLSIELASIHLENGGLGNVRA